MTVSSLTNITEQVQRIKFGGMCVDVVSTSKGSIRIGSMPDIAKFLKEHFIQETVVVVPDWEVTQAGDNRTGEEFILWHAQLRGGVLKKYVGLKSNVDQVRHHLNSIFPYYFDKECLSVVRKTWLSDWFQEIYALPIYKDGNLEIQCDGGNVVITDGGQSVYNQEELTQVFSPDSEVESVLEKIPRDSVFRESLEILPIGCGNGFYGTVSNAIVRFADYVIWIDPCGYPAHSLARHNLHWDDITHFLFTHNHEDHTQGFTACLARVCKYKRKLNLIVTGSAYKLLNELYTPLFPDLKTFVNVTELCPGKPLHLGSVKIESRWNHHILPYGTIGLKISAGGKCFGYSGDTKYDEHINSVLKRKELTADWFQPCDLVFHEIEFDNPQSVHTHWKQVKALARKIPGRVLGYHTDIHQDSPFELVREGELYILA